MPIQAPFGQARIHVFHSPRVRRLGGRRLVAGSERRLSPRASGVLPLGFRGQAVGFPFLFGEPLAECHRVIPTHAAGIRTVSVVAFKPPPELPELFRSHLGFADEECFRNRHGMARRLVKVAIRIPFRHQPWLGLYQVRGQRFGIDSHYERARLNRNELHLDGIDFRPPAAVCQYRDGHSGKSCEQQNRSELHPRLCRLHNYYTKYHQI